MITLIIIVIVVIIIKTNKNKNLSLPTPYSQDEELKVLEENYKKKYTKCNYLLTKEELKFYKILKRVTNKLGYSLFCQVSLYEIINSINFKDFNKIKSKSIDFVITQENCRILMCIELDDYTHQRKNRIQRDDFINKLFDDLEIKLIRIPVQNFYNMEELEIKIKEIL